MEELNYSKVFNVLTARFEQYCIEYKIKSLVLGISGGIDSTVVAAIAREVCDRVDIPLIGRSLPIKNKKDEFDASELVGKAFCDDFEVVPLKGIYNELLDFLEEPHILGSGENLISKGNVQARLRMIYLYNIASMLNGMVLSTDNQTEYQLGFWTIHGDVGDYDPIQALWKTEVYGLANWLLKSYRNSIEYLCSEEVDCDASEYFDKSDAMEKSISLTPTDGLGISNSDLDQIGAKSYEEVDVILKALLTPTNSLIHKSLIGTYYEKYGKDVVDKIWDRHINSEFKRMKAPISVPRSELL